MTIFSAPGIPGPPRVAVVAGRWIGTAVRRNRCKRRLREAVARVPLGEGRDYVVIAGEAVHDAAFETLVAWVRKCADEEKD